MVTNKLEVRQVGRPRQFDDDVVFMAAARVLVLQGYERLTLDSVANEVGCTGPALIKRFGSKRGLISGYLKWSNDAAIERFERVRTEHASPLHALRARFVIPAEERPDEIADPAGYWNIVEFYMAARTDASLRPLLDERTSLFRREIVRLLEEAQNAGEIVEGDCPRIGQLLLTALTGAALQSILSDGPRIERRLGETIDAILLPYLSHAPEPTIF